MAEQKRVRRFDRNNAADRHLAKDGRKADSNYFRRFLRGKKIAYIHHLIANTDQLLITVSAREPEFKSGLVDRFLILAMLEEVAPVVAVTKTDLADPEELEDIRAIWARLDLPMIFVSSETGEGIGDLAAALTGRHTAIVGHSGVGKTTMLRLADPAYVAATASISHLTGRGRHTTSVIRRHDLTFGGMVYDMPGLKEIDFMSLRRREVAAFYPEFADVAPGCRFNDCLHVAERDCAVQNAVAEDLIHAERYQNYLQILQSLPEESR